MPVSQARIAHKQSSRTCFKILINLKVYLRVNIKIIYFIGNLSIYIRSEGYEMKGNTESHGTGIIQVNGTDYSPHGRGYNLVTVNADTGAINFIILLFSRIILVYYCKCCNFPYLFLDRQGVAKKSFSVG